MKKQRIKNRVYLSILLAILMQCILFGIILLSVGIYGDILEEPCRILRSQMEEKNKLVSQNMNNTLLEGNKLFGYLEKLEDDRAVQEKIVESLSRQNSVTGIFYANVTEGTGVYFLDNEAFAQAAGYGDISCRIGQVKTEYNIALDTKWRGKLSASNWEEIQEYLNGGGERNRWIYHNGGLYYVISSEYRDVTRVLALEMERYSIESMMRLDQQAYDGMQVLIMEENRILYGPALEEGGEVEAEPDGVFTYVDNGVKYVGIRGQLQSYGRIQDDRHLYIGMMCREEAITRLGRAVTVRVVLAYGISILIAGIFSYLALWQVMKPWNQLHEDIKKQDMSKIHFEETGIVEIDTVYKALNSMMTQLERSYARHTFAMEAAENLGSFEYQYGRDEVAVSSAVRKILEIPDDLFQEENKIGVQEWAVINTGLHPVEGMAGYLFHTRDGGERYITIQTKEEASGIFGVMIDKTEEYNKISSLRYLSEHDHLTGLFNGAYFREEGQKILNSTGWKRSRQTVQAVVFCDLDNLKKVNDTYGHVGGDAYLCGMAGWLQDITEKEDSIVARMSGDEFAVLFYGYNSREEILEHMEEAYETRPVIVLGDGISVRLSASVGIAFHTGRGGSLEQMLKEADEAMYLRKHGTKNGLCVYEQKNEPDVP